MNISSEAYAEVDEFLSLIDDSFVLKIPKRLRDYFKEKKSENYTFKIDKDIPIKDQNLHADTLAMIAALNLEYWCENDVERMRLTEIYKENERIREEKLKEQYNTNNLFNKDKLNSINEEKVEKIKEEISDNEIAKYESNSFFDKILNEIKRLFKL